MTVPGFCLQSWTSTRRKYVILHTLNATPHP